MGVLSVGRRARQIPPTYARLERSHPLAQGIISLWWPGITRDLVDDATWTKSSLATPIVATPYGKALSADSTSQAAWTRTDPFPTDRARGAIMIVQKTLSLAGDGCCVGVNSTNPSRWGAHCPYSPGNIDFDCGNEASHRLTLSAGSVTWGNWNTIALTNGPRNGQAIWIDGTRRATTAESTDIHSTPGTIYGWGVHDSIRSQQNEVAVLAAWKTEPSAEMIGAFHMDPFQMVSY